MTAANRVRPIAWVALAVLSFIAPAHAGEINLDWQGGVGAPCEGVGVHGAFRVHAQLIANADRQGAQRIRHASVHATSSIFQTGKGSFSGTVEVLDRKGSVLEKANLVPPTPPAIIPTPKPTETYRKYLPNGRQLTVPADGKLRIHVAAVVQMDPASTCALGTTSHAIVIP